MKKETLYIYTRVSTDKQAEKGYSLEAQKKAGIEKAKQLKMDYKIYEEPAKSADKEDLINRPIFTKIIDLVKSGVIKHLFAIEWSRISRNEINTAYIKKELKENGVIVYTASGTFDLADYNSDFIASIILLNANRENRERVERSKRGRLEAVLQGKWSGGICAYGYTIDKNKNLVIDEDEKKIYLKMVKYSLNGMGAGTIAKKLNEENIPTKAQFSYKKGINLRDKYTGETKFKNKSRFIWKQGTIEKILKNPLYKGERHYKDKVIECPKLIDVKTWQKIQDNFEKNRNFSGRNNKKNFYLLKGLLFCNRCGRVLIGRISEKKGMRVYYCMSKRSEETHFCGMRSINIDAINKLVWEKLLYVLSNSDLVRKELKKKFVNNKTNIDEINKEINSLKNRLIEIENEKSNLIRLATKEIITETDLNKHLKDIETNKNEVENRIQLNEDKITLSLREETTFQWLLQIEEKTKELYYLKDENKKQEIIRSFINKINVDWLEKENEHIVSIDLKYPLFTDKTSQHEFLLNGLDLTDINENDKTSLQEKYEIEAEEIASKNISSDKFTELKQKALKQIKKNKTKKSIETLPYQIPYDEDS